MTNRADILEAPSVGCAGKRSFSSYRWAQRGLRKASREGGHGTERGRLHVYKCDECHGWHIGRAPEMGRPKRRQPPKRSADFGKGAQIFALAETVAKDRFPDGANAGQLAQILRELLASESPTLRAHASMEKNNG